ncbi:hypothetical protein [Frankia tisae]|uniref:hypothetical protein n=1 Tax=Frankia tisae TaxID=2950104 RepID=UPI0021BF76C1|nr:hypothetical protein [Frankia tisae]
MGGASGRVSKTTRIPRPNLARWRRTGEIALTPAEADARRTGVICVGLVRHVEIGAGLGGLLS